MPHQTSEQDHARPISPLQTAQAAVAIAEEAAAGGLTPETAALWPGWGVVAPAFDSDATGGWRDLYDRLEDALPPAWMKTAAESLDTSFYTPPWLASTVWEMVVWSGFTGGRVLLPGVGAGVFVEQTPTVLDVDWTGVEIDHTTAAVAGARFPDLTIQRTPIEKADLPTNGFDLAIGNVPFASDNIYDQALNESISGLHNYCIRRATAAVRPGGLVAVITSRHTADAIGHRWPAEVSAMVRLPAVTFPGTKVVADIVVLRVTEGARAWAHGTYPLLADGESELDARFAPRVSTYWGDHPEHVAGRMGRSGNRFSGFVEVTSDDVRADVDAAVRSAGRTLLPMRPWSPVPGLDDSDSGPVVDAREHSFRLGEDGAMQRVSCGQLVPVKASAELRALVRLRDLTERLLELEADHTLTDLALNEPRGELASAYRAYVARHGPVGRGVLHEGKEDPETGQPVLTWRRPTLGGFRGDPQSYLVFALEHFDAATGQAREAAILTERVNQPAVRRESADTDEEALAISLAETGGIDLARIAGLRGDDEASVTDRLSQARLIFWDPERGAWSRAVDYLSGDIRARIAAAETAGLDGNVAVLNEVMPAQLEAVQIRVRLGAPWVGSSMVSDFMREVLGGGRIEHCPETGRWEVVGSGVPAEARMAYGTSRVAPHEILEDALNGRSTVVYDEVREDWTTRKVRRVEETIAAQQKASALHDRFGAWVWEDAERAAVMVERYNRLFASHSPRRGDGSYLTEIPGMAADADPLWTWQRDMVDRNLNTPATLCGHAVGAGKTKSMLTTAYMLRRYGLATKPLIVVPNNLLEQIATEAVQMFPTGKWLVAGTDDLSGDNRRRFVARCATGDWDGVILTHSGFGLIPTHPSTERAWIEARKDELDHALRSGSSYFSGKAIARKLRSLDRRLENLVDTERDRHGVFFEQLGVDHLSVDEAHAFLRLPIDSNATGFSMGSSKRATDLWLKIEWLRQRAAQNGTEGRPHLAFYTGTPWRNTLAETFVWQTYLHPERLAEARLSRFDDWAATFVAMETRVEPSPDGSGLRVVQRPSRLQNLPELMRMLGEVADIITSEDLALPRPEVRRHLELVDRNAAQIAFGAGLIERAEKIRGQGRRNEKGSDNILAIGTAGRMASLDPRLVGEDAESPKIARVAERVAERWRADRDHQVPGSDIPGSLQLVFCDYGTPKPDDTATYGRLRRLLIERGVPAQLIRFAHDAKDDKARARLWSGCRNGAVGVLVASTEKAGVGANIQTRLGAIHHVTAPWRPSDLEQRDGRGVRYGNTFGTVDIHRYAVSQTFDVFEWSTLTRKASWLGQLLSAVCVREVDDIGAVEVDYATTTAAIAGDERLFERARLASIVRDLRILRSVESQTAVAARQRAKEAQESAATLLNAANSLEDMAQIAAEYPEDRAEIDRLRDAVTRCRLAARRRETLPTFGCERSWRGLSVGVNQDRWTGESAPGVKSLRLTVAKRRYDWGQTVPTDPADWGSKDAPSRVVAALREWVTRMPALADEHRDRAAALSDGAKADLALVDAWRFSREAELSDAELRLTRLDAELEEAAGSYDVGSNAGGELAA